MMSKCPSLMEDDVKNSSYWSTEYIAAGENQASSKRIHECAQESTKRIHASAQESTVSTKRGIHASAQESTISTKRIHNTSAEESTISTSAQKQTELNDFPDELLQICLARLPLRCIPVVKAVSKRWFGLADARYLYELRRILRLTESSTYILNSKYELGHYAGLQGSAQEVGNFRRPIALLKGPQRLQFAAAAGSDGHLYILGGRSPLISKKLDSWVVFSRVDSYDPICNCWTEVKSMKTPRYACAAGSFIDGKDQHARLIVAGGYDEGGAALASAEVYDSVKNEWEMIPSMVKISGACKGEVSGGRFYVKMANNGPDAVEIYDPSVRCWVPSSPDCQNAVHSCFETSDKAFSGGAIILYL